MRERNVPANGRGPPHFFHFDGNFLDPRVWRDGDGDFGGDPCTLVLGDMNGDGVVDGTDVQLFVNNLLQP